MYQQNPCVFDGCDQLAVSGAATCARHLDDGGLHLAETVRKLTGSDTITSLNLAGLSFDGLDLTGKRFFACSFAGSTLKNVSFAGSAFRMCFFDFSTIDSCNFSETDIHFCSFAGAQLSNVSFERLELVHDNFNGVHNRDCTFNDSNLYNSRIIMAELDATDFVD